MGSGSCTSIAFSGAKVAAALGAGVVFNVANLLLVVAFTLAGLAVAFPLVIGTALVVGVLVTVTSTLHHLSYKVRVSESRTSLPEGNPLLGVSAHAWTSIDMICAT